MITRQQFTPSQDSPFSFRVILDGSPYNVIVTWNIYGQRYYVNIYTTQGSLVLSTPLIESPDGYDISMVNGLFDSTLVFRDTLQQFEVNDAPIQAVPGEYLAPPDYMLDAAGNQFILGISQLGASAPGQMFDALGNPFVLNQSTMSGDVMLDNTGATLILDQGQIAQTQDLSSQQMLGKDGQPLTLDNSQI